MPIRQKNLCECGASKEFDAKRCRLCYNKNRKNIALDRVEKSCSKCNRVKFLTDFSTDKRTIDGRQSICRACQKQWAVESGYSAQTKYRLEKIYGITLAEYLSIFERQNAQCAGCNNQIIEFGKSTHLDHNHTTGVIRGILCRPCNTTLGHAQDNINRLRGLIHYLEYKAT